MNRLEKEIVKGSRIDTKYQFNSLGAWDTLKILGVTKSLHKYPKSIVCAILKCAHKRNQDVKNIHSIVIVSMNDFKLHEEIKITPEKYLVESVLAGTIEIGPDAKKTVENKYSEFFADV